MKRKFDTQSIGFIFGLILPVLGVFLYYFIQRAYMSGQSYNALTFETYKEMLTNRKVLPSILSMGVLLNLVAFFIANHFNKLRMAQGIVAATILYAFVIIILKFF